MISNNREDYLKAIFQVNEHKKVATNSMIAKRLNVSRASVSEMLDKLQNQGYVKQYEEGFILTEMGNDIAKILVTKHRLWELFLIKALQYDEAKVHDEAEELEHATSDELMYKLYEFLGKPKSCPHDEKIYID